MDYREYFRGRKGTGVLATADSSGAVDAAIYATPHVIGEGGTLAFIMQERLSHENLQSNDRAVYLFREEGTGYQGLRLFLRKVREEKDSELLHRLRRRTDPAGVPLYLVFFEVEKELPLIGSGEEADE